AELTARMLTRLGYHVLLAEGPTEAIKLAIENISTIQILVTDVIMPVMNGVTLAAEIEKIIPHMICLFISGYPSSTLDGQILNGEHHHFLAKPFTIKELAQKLTEMLEGSSESG
ncbi:MAG: response regulator, partial [Actinomycetota bacterium]|nr:response regulator [Actinomycetota bacterium]